MESFGVVAAGGDEDLLRSVVHVESTLELYAAKFAGHCYRIDDDAVMEHRLYTGKALFPASSCAGGLNGSISATIALPGTWVSMLTNPTAGSARVIACGDDAFPRESLVVVLVRAFGFTHVKVVSLRDSLGDSEFSSVLSRTR